jgi:hypothetical protein
VFHKNPRPSKTALKPLAYWEKNDQYKWLSSHNLGDEVGVGIEKFGRHYLPSSRGRNKRPHIAKID